MASLDAEYGKHFELVPEICTGNKLAAAVADRRRGNATQVHNRATLILSARYCLIEIESCFSRKAYRCTLTEDELASFCKDAMKSQIGILRPKSAVAMAEQTADSALNVPSVSKAANAVLDEVANNRSSEDH